MKFYVFGIPTNNASKVLFTAELLGLDYELQFLNPQEGEHKSADFIAINPLGRIPVLDHAGDIITESSTIARYLCSVCDNRLYGKTALERASVDQWVDLMSHDIGPQLATYTYQEIILPNLMGKEGDAELVEKAGHHLKSHLPLIEAQLAKTRWLAGNELTLADSIAHAFFAATQGTSFSYSGYPLIEQWNKKLASMPQWQSMLAKFPK